jgi:hypothetical protein
VRAATARLVSHKSKENDHMRRFRLSILLAAGIGMSGTTQSLGEQICKPRLSFKEVRFAPAKNLQRKWTAVLEVDASRCAVESGRFDIRFVRLKEYAPDLEFSEQFTWWAGQIEVSIEFWIDEAVHEYAIDSVGPCPCRN